MTRVLVTGSAGYIGSVLVPYLNEAGFECRGSDTGFFEHGLLYPPAEREIRHRDARDIGPEDLEGVDAVIHLAGISNDPMGNLNPSAVYDPTREYSLAIARMCKERGIRFIFASSCSIYGIGSEDLLDETSPTQPQTAYSLNKLQIEEDLRSIADSTFSPIALRFATVFGSSPRIRFDVVVNMLTGMAATTGRVVLNSDGSAWRPNVHILDVCEAVRRAVDVPHDTGELLVLNVGDEENNVRVIDIARMVERAVPGCEVAFLSQDPSLDKDGLIRDRKVKGADTRTYRVSFERIREAFPGFRCRWSLADGIAEMVSRFTEAGLDEASFRTRTFYRLQELEYLLSNGYLDTELRWKKPRPEPTLATGASLGGDS